MKEQILFSSPYNIIGKAYYFWEYYVFQNKMDLGEYIDNLILDLEILSCVYDFTTHSVFIQLGIILLIEIGIL